MADYILSCCSTADLSEAHFCARDIRYICFHYMLDGKSYEDDLGKSMPIDQFYQAMTDGADTRTSQVNADEYTAYFEGFLREGRDVLHVCLSSGISFSNGTDSPSFLRWHLFRRSSALHSFLQASTNQPIKLGC